MLGLLTTIISPGCSLGAIKVMKCSPERGWLRPGSLADPVFNPVARISYLLPRDGGPGASAFPPSLQGLAGYEVLDESCVYWS